MKDLPGARNNYVALVVSPRWSWIRKQAWDSGSGGPLVARCEAPESVAPTCDALARALLASGAPNGNRFATMVTGGGSVHCYVLYDENGKPLGDFLAPAADAAQD